MDYKAALVRLLHNGQFANWEKLALLPRGVKPSELQARQHVAQVMSDLRLGRALDLDPALVLDELRKLVMAQTKAYNAVQVYEDHELETLRQTVAGLSHWSRLVKLLGQVRQHTAARYERYIANQGKLSDRLAA